LSNSVFDFPYLPSTPRFFLLNSIPFCSSPFPISVSRCRVATAAFVTVSRFISASSPPRLVLGCFPFSPSLSFSRNSGVMMTDCISFFPFLAQTDCRRFLFLWTPPCLSRLLFLLSFVLVFVGFFVFSSFPPLTYPPVIMNLDLSGGRTFKSAPLFHARPLSACLSLSPFR